MTRGRKTGGRDVVKGQILNPKGRSKELYELSDIQHFTKAQLLKTMCELLAINAIELRERVEAEEGTAAEMMIGALITNAIKKGCYNRANFICSYVLGRPKVYEMEEDPKGFQPQNLEGIPSEFLIEVIKAQLAKETHAAAQPRKTPAAIKSR